MTESRYEFTYRDDYNEEIDSVFGQRNITTSVTLDDGAQWSAVLKHFVEFLSHVYGYDISDKVDYPDPLVPNGLIGQYVNTVNKTEADSAWQDYMNSYDERLQSLKARVSAFDTQVGGSHYKDKGTSMQPWAIIDAWGLDFYAGNVLKYLLRHQYKDGVEDLKKARHYLDRMIEKYDENPS